jgi:hypothetical protein
MTAASTTAPLDGARLDDAPPVIARYFAYCRLAATLFMASSALGLVLVLGRERWAASADLEPVALLLLGILWTMTMWFLASVHWAALQTRQRQPWAWSLHAVVIGVGLTTLILWPLTFPLLARWLKPETQRWFGRVPFQERDREAQTP